MNGLHSAWRLAEDEIWTLSVSSELRAHRRTYLTVSAAILLVAYFDAQPASLSAVGLALVSKTEMAWILIAMHAYATLAYLLAALPEHARLSLALEQGRLRTFRDLSSFASARAAQRAYARMQCALQLEHAGGVNQFEAVASDDIDMRAAAHDAAAQAALSGLVPRGIWFLRARIQLDLCLAPAFGIWAWIASLSIQNGSIRLLGI